MKLVTSTALALVIAAGRDAGRRPIGSMAPAAPTMQAVPRAAGQPQPPAETQQQDQAVEESALKAIVELQDAVNKNDYANVPAKVAAAQAVAKTKEDRYLIGQMQLKAALAAKDNAGVAAAIDASPRPATSMPRQRRTLRQRLARPITTTSNMPQAAAAFQKAAAARPAELDARGAARRSAVRAGDRKPGDRRRSSARFRPASPPARNRMKICTSARSRRL